MRSRRIRHLSYLDHTAKLVCNKSCITKRNGSYVSLFFYKFIPFFLSVVLPFPIIKCKHQYLIWNRLSTKRFVNLTEFNYLQKQEIWLDFDRISIHFKILAGPTGLSSPPHHRLASILFYMLQDTVYSSTI